MISTLGFRTMPVLTQQYDVDAGEVARRTFTLVLWRSSVDLQLLRGCRRHWHPSSRRLERGAVEND